MILRIPFSKFADASSDFACASAIENFSKICLGVNILILSLRRKRLLPNSLIWNNNYITLIPFLNH